MDCLLTHRSHPKCNTQKTPICLQLQQRAKHNLAQNIFETKITDVDIQQDACECVCCVLSSPALFWSHTSVSESDKMAVSLRLQKSCINLRPGYDGVRARSTMFDLHNVTRTVRTITLSKRN